jgi:hypothetical protein
VASQLLMVLCESDDEGLHLAGPPGMYREDVRPSPSSVSHGHLLFRNER